MLTTVNKCDLCGVDGPSPGVMLWRLRVRVNRMDGVREEQPGFNPFQGHDHTLDVCRSCMIDLFGLWGPWEDDPRKTTPPDAPPTIEDVIRELIESALDDRGVSP
jgi:hypothetical protein